MWDLIVSVPDHCLSFYFPYKIWLQSAKQFLRKRSLKILTLGNLGPRSVNYLDL